MQCSKNALLDHLVGALLEEPGSDIPREGGGSSLGSEGTDGPSGLINLL